MNKMNTKIVEYFKLKKVKAAAIKDLKNDAKRNIEIAERNFDIGNRLVRFLPEGWNFRYQFGELYIEKGDNESLEHDGDPLEFRVICDHLDRIIGFKGDRKYSNLSQGGALVSSWVRWGKDHIYIQVRLGSPKCKVEFKEEWTKPEKKILAIVPNECLGIKREARNE